jgi:SLAP domain-containing protein
MLGKEFTISYAPKEERTVSKLAEKLYYEDLNTLTDIEDNSVVFKTMYIFEIEREIEVKVFIINSTNKTINFEYLPLEIVDENNRIIACELLKLVEVGEVPPMHVRPFSIFFSISSKIPGEVLNERCTLVIKNDKIIPKISRRTVISSMDENIPLYERKVLENYINNMPPLISNTVKMIPYKSEIDEQGDKYSILILANGSKENIQLSDINMIYRDAAGFVQAHKKVSSLGSVPPNSTSVYKIVLEQKDIIKDPFNPAQCKLIIEK